MGSDNWRFLMPICLSNHFLRCRQHFDWTTDTFFRQESIVSSLSSLLCFSFCVATSRSRLAVKIFFSVPMLCTVGSGSILLFLFVFGVLHVFDRSSSTLLRDRLIGLTVSEHSEQKMEYICSDLSWSTDYCSGFACAVERNLTVPVL